MNSEELQELYQQIILDHNKYPRNHRRIEHPTHMAHGHNALCGDEINVYLELKEGVIRDISFDGEGCAISRASASLMTELLKGKTLAEAEKQFRDLTELLGETELPPMETLLMEKGDLAALSGVRKFPARIKCATLAWQAFSAAVKERGMLSTEG